ncbi:MAG: hypothetical protein AB1324_03060 [Candidatus Micrarchaeota archaeon]
MRHFPYFLTDAALLAIALAAVALPLVFQGMLNYGLAILSAGIFIFLYRKYESSVDFFDSAIRKVDGAKGWESDFSSNRTIIVDYRGEKAGLESHVVSMGKTVSVDYSASFRNGSAVSFEARKAEDGGFIVEGNKIFFAAIADEVRRFDRSYQIKSISNASGGLTIVVSLEFEPGPPPSKEAKLSDMSSFISDFLAFGFLVNSKLRSPLPETQQKPKKTRKKAKK